MRSVLFVDDEPMVLDGLRRLLRPLRHEWEMEFVTSGRAALEVLERRALDVVVTDMRMPEMDGAQLLEEVRARQPKAVRIMLTGQTDREGSLRTVACAHRFIAKPCDPELIQQTLERACRLRALVSDERVAAVAGAIGTLPSLPDTYHELTREMRSGDASPRRVSEILGKDLGMTAKVLQLVNSAFFGLPRRVATVEQAVRLLGTELLRTMVLAHDAFAVISARDPSVDLGALQQHSLAVAAAARAIASHEAGGHVEDATQAGFLHDIGRLVFATALGREAAAAAELARHDGIPLHVAEAETIGCHHGALGAYLLGLWGLPDDVVEAVAFHHDPAAVGATGFSTLLAVYAANALVNGDGPASMIDDALAACGCADRLAVWQPLLKSLSLGAAR